MSAIVEFLVRSHETADDMSAEERLQLMLADNAASTIKVLTTSIKTVSGVGDELASIDVVTATVDWTQLESKLLDGMRIANLIINEFKWMVEILSQCRLELSNDNLMSLVRSDSRLMEFEFSTPEFEIAWYLNENRADIDDAVVTAHSELSHHVSEQLANKQLRLYLESILHPLLFAPKEFLGGSRGHLDYMTAKNKGLSWPNLLS